MGVIARFVFLITLVLNSSAALCAQPHVVLVEHDPWLTVIGSDSPTVVLYSNGFVIFRARDASSSPSGYFSTQLTTARYKKLLAEIAPGSLSDLEDSYTASLSTDQPMNKLHVWANGNRKSVMVYGALRRDPEARSRVPNKFLRAFDALITFSVDASPWVPDRTEILIGLMTTLRKGHCHGPKAGRPLRKPERGELKAFINSSFQRNSSANSANLSAA